MRGMLWYGFSHLYARFSVLPPSIHIQKQIPDDWRPRKVNRIHPPPRRGLGGHLVPLPPSTARPGRHLEQNNIVANSCGRAFHDRVKREQRTPPHATPPMGTGRRFATAPAPATTPERASGASRTCRFDVCESRRGPLRVWKAASKSAPVRVELRRASNRCAPAEDGAQCH